jgi:hypothetical protein
LNLCFENKIEETLAEQTRIDINAFDLQSIFERTSTFSDFSTMVNRLHAGQKLRGHERKVFKFSDGTSGDSYRCVLLAIQIDPPALTISYDEMLKRISERVCRGSSGGVKCFKHAWAYDEYRINCSGGACHRMG